jgi:Fe-S-cluster containining protein
MGSKSLKIPPLRFECTGCGKCCTQRGDYAHVYVGDREVRALATLLGTSPARFRREHTEVDALGWRQLRFRDGLCTFLDPQSQRCTVYAARPIQCRTFPFWPEILGPKGWSDEVKELCEGIDRGDVVPADTVSSALREMRAADSSED